MGRVVVLLRGWLAALATAVGSQVAAGIGLAVLSAITLAFSSVRVALSTTPPLAFLLLPVFGVVLALVALGLWSRRVPRVLLDWLQDDVLWPVVIAGAGAAARVRPSVAICPACRAGVQEVAVSQERLLGVPPTVRWRCGLCAYVGRTREWHSYLDTSPIQGLLAGGRTPREVRARAAELVEPFVAEVMRRARQAGRGGDA